MKNPHIPSIARAVQLIALGLACAACGSRPAVRTTPPPAVVEMEPMVVEYDAEADPDDAVQAYDAQSLFEDAQAAFERHDFAACDTLYGKLFERFPQSRYVHSGLYNRGLCLEQLGEHGRAATHFRRHAQLATALRDQRDGEFRWGYNLVKTGDYPTALHLYNRLLEAEDLTPLDRAEVVHGLDGPGPVTAEDPRRLRIDDWPAGAHLGRLGGWGMIDGVGGPDLVVSQHSTEDDEAALIYVYFDPGPA